ncbi:PREDICTED: uncharacterized protein LOC109241948 [Nicotiana attenuata]|uniref:uncharacterized protein LOC109241948 n=1 Tax=Nicotiana attenuata TaxID=49451 RepID=UPI0009047AA6|nr:PREDICTED: uncharacterized protein LOC109241948 [Nicotiana attenuata]
MSFKDIPEARKCIKLYCLANKVELEVVKSDKHRLRYECVPGCPFGCHISEEKGSPGVKIKTLNLEHECGPSYDNSRVDYTTIAHYFKKKLQDIPKFKVKEMRTDLKEAFEVNASKGKCKRAKRMVLEILDGSFTDGYKKLEAYANELRDSNPGSDVVINLSKEALAEGKRKFLRMYISFKAMKMGFKEAWEIVDKETKRTWNWFLGLLQHSLELQMGEGITFMSDMQKILEERYKPIIGMLEGIRIKVMNQLREHEDLVTKWSRNSVLKQ